MGYDLDPLRCIEERKRFYAHAIPENWLVLFTHDHDTPMGRVVLNDRASRSSPVDRGAPPPHTFFSKILRNKELWAKYSIQTVCGQNIDFKQVSSWAEMEGQALGRAPHKGVPLFNDKGCVKPLWCGKCALRWSEAGSEGDTGVRKEQHRVHSAQRIPIQLNWLLPH
jgi:hypothetical protein